MANIVNTIQNGSLANGTNNWSTSSNYSYSSNGEYTTATCNRTESGTYPTSQAFTLIDGKYEDENQIIYVAATVRGRTTNTSYPRVYISLYPNGVIENLSYHNLTCESDGEWHTLTARLQTYNSATQNYYDYFRIAFGIFNSTQGDIMDIKNVGVYNLTQIFGRGNEPSKSWCDKYLDFGTDYIEYKPSSDLIYDRTQNDVNYVINNPQSSLFLKGAYNYVDLNRIEEWCDYLAGELLHYGYSVSITTKKDWSMSDFPTTTEMNRIRSNLQKLKNAYYSVTGVPTVQNMTYQKANQIEKVLHEIDTRINAMANYFVYMGVANMGQNRVWQNRFRRVENTYIYKKWEELTEETWNDFEETDRWEDIIK